MTITSSQITSQVTQVDGRISVTERFVDQYGLVYHESKWVASGTDLNAQLAADAAALDASLTANEISTNVSNAQTYGSLASWSTSYSTATQNADAFRAAYAVATETQAIMIGDFLNTFSDTVIGNAFGLNPAQVTQLRNNKLIPDATLAADIRAATGA